METKTKIIYIKNRKDLLFWFFVISFLVSILESLKVISIISRLGFVIMLIFLIMLFVTIEVKEKWNRIK